MRVSGLLRDIPIRRKLTIITMLTSGLALLLVGLALVGYEQWVFRSAMLDRLSLTAAMVADNSAAALTFNDSASAAQTLHTLSADKHIVGAAIYDIHGKVFASFQRRLAGSGFTIPTAEAAGERFDGEFLRLFREIAVAGERAGTVYIQSDLAEMHARVWRYALIVVSVLAAASAAAMLLAMRLHALISGPVSHLARVVHDVTQHKNYAVRAVKEGDDELGRLIEGFNAMLGQIQAQGSALQQAHDDLERRVEERTGELQTEVANHKRAKQELERVHRELVDASRQAGMAEIATNVLHNVGNVLNSVNVSALLAADLARKSKVSGLARVVELLRAQEHDLAGFMTRDPRGQHLVRHLANLAEHLKMEQETLVRELESVRTHTEHIKDIVAMQQNYAKVAGACEIIAAVDLVEDSLRMNEDALHRHRVEVVREFVGRPQLNVDKHKVLQILVNLVRNAKNACEESSETGRRVTVGVASAGERVRISVADNGVGIAPENMTRIFNHGFTTRAAGHGFGLHSGALAARELGGALTAHSEGVGRGATFVLELPLHAMEAVHA